MNTSDHRGHSKLRTPQAADYVNKSRSSLEKLRVAGGGPKYIKLGKTVVYDLVDLDEWLEANRRRSTSDGPHRHE